MFTLLQKVGQEWVFFLIAVLLSPLIGFLIALVVSPIRANTEAAAIASGDVKKCPYCAELVKAEAKLCKHCGSSLEPSPIPSSQGASSLSDEEAMRKFGISFESGQYVFKTHRYDRLGDAINYAKHQSAKPSSTVV